MRDTKPRLAWRPASVAVVIMALLLAACGDDTVDPEPPLSLSSEELLSVLTDMDEQAVNDWTIAPMTYEQVVEEGTFDLPPQMVFEPASCATYAEDVIGVPEGWAQFGARAITDTHMIFFLQSASNTPGVDIETIKESAATCEEGILTLDDGETRVTARASFTFLDPPKFDGAETFSMVQTTHFEETDPAAVALIESFGYLSATDCIQYTNFIQIVDVLLLSQDVDEARSMEIVTDMYDNVQALRG